MISGKRKITVRMVAEAAGVSRTAVYAVLNRDAKNNIGLRPDTRRKIEKTIEELGYIPNNSARTLVSGRSNNIGILLNTSNVMFSRVIGDLLAETCVEHGYMPLLEFYNFNLELERRKLEMLFSRGVDGLFAITGGERNLDVYKRFTDFHLPLVMLGHNTPGGPNVSRVGVSEERIAATLIDFLVGNRVKSVSYLTFSEMVSNPISIREQCIFRGLEAAGIRLAGRYAVSCHRETVAKMRRLLAAPGRPDALCCFTDELANSAVTALMECGSGVDELPVIGIDGLEMPFNALPLTSVRNPVEDIIFSGWQLFENALLHGKYAAVELSARMVLRDTTPGFRLPDR
ncbi:hypothetical protein C5Q97_07925 [Victivallales bacterium CCUG 44730]|nr:hypothetical protein C5Q97_07925 [Victivallales bacterium CCUG 44730]